MKIQYFEGDSYSTDLSQRPSGLFGWFRRSQIMAFINLAKIVLRSKRLALAGKYNLNEWTKSSFDVIRMLEQSGAVFNIKGLNNIRNLEQPVVFVSNHISIVEALVYPCLIAPIRDLTFVVKRGLVDHPSFGPVLKARGPIVVSRDNSRNDLLLVLNKGTDYLRKNTSIIIFPQSTRRDYFKIREFNTLGVKLASKNELKVVPIAINSLYWKKGKFFSYFGPFDRSQQINIAIGEPIMEVKDKDTHQSVINFIVGKLKTWNVRVEE